MPHTYTVTFTLAELAIACVAAAMAYGLWLVCADTDRAKRRSMRRKRTGQIRPHRRKCGQISIPTLDVGR
jgi:hypothetical protein